MVSDFRKEGSMSSNRIRVFSLARFLVWEIILAHSAEQKQVVKFV